MRLDPALIERARIVFPSAIADDGPHPGHELCLLNIVESVSESSTPTLLAKSIHVRAGRTVSYRHCRCPISADHILAVTSTGRTEDRSSPARRCTCVLSEPPHRDSPFVILVSNPLALHRHECMWLRRRRRRCILHSGRSTHQSHAPRLHQLEPPLPQRE